MKTYLIFLTILLSSCVYRIDKEKASKHVHLEDYRVKVIDVRVAKYSSVNMIVTYKGKDYRVRSAGGYYYKKYDLKAGDEINVDIDIYFFTEKNDEDNLYDDTTYLVFEPIDVSKWEKKKRIMETCKHCGKLKGNHHAHTLNCPMPGRGNFKAFHPTQKFEAKPSRGKKKETFQL